jgi:predicted PurR-regulated permease PerM
MRASESVRERVDAAVPFGVRLAGAWSWPLIGLGIVGFAVLTLLTTLREVTIPFVIAVLLTGLLWPLRRTLVRRGAPKAVAVVVPFLGLIVAILGLLTAVFFTVRAGIGGFSQHALTSYRALLDYLQDPPFNVSPTQVANAFTSAEATLKANSSNIASGVLSGAGVAGHFVIGLLLTLFVTLFLLIDAPGIWRWTIRLAPSRARAAIDGAGAAAWRSIGEYARVQVVVALTDGIGVGVIAFILHVPFPVPIGVLVFLGAFIPIVGSVTAGSLAVLVALVYNGPINAVAMLGGVLLVNQVESHVLHPLMMGGAVSLHPIAVVLAVASGSILAGIIGALFAVPLTAAANSAIKYLAGGAWRQPEPPTDPPPTAHGPEPLRDGGADPEDVTTVA